MALIPPVLLKLASTGYRFVRYYSGSQSYKAKGAPSLPLRVLAPALVTTTIVVLATGVLLLEKGHKGGSLLEVHKVSFIVWAVLFVVHFIAYARRAARSVLLDWGRARREVVPGVGLRAMLLVAALGGGAALAIALLPMIDRWHP